MTGTYARLRAYTNTTIDRPNKSYYFPDCVYILSPLFLYCFTALVSVSTSVVFQSHSRVKCHMVHSAVNRILFCTWNFQLENHRLTHHNRPIINFFHNCDDSTISCSLMQYFWAQSYTDKETFNAFFVKFIYIFIGDLNSCLCYCIDKLKWISYVWITGDTE